MILMEDTMDRAVNGWCGDLGENEAFGIWIGRLFWVWLGYSFRKYDDYDNVEYL